MATHFAPPETRNQIVLQFASLLIRRDVDGLREYIEGTNSIEIVSAVAKCCLCDTMPPTEMICDLLAEATYH